MVTRSASGSSGESPDQRRDALLIEVVKQPPESRDELRERLRREREAASGARRERGNRQADSRRE